MSDDALKTGTIVFTDAVRPALQAGDYWLTVEQTVAVRATDSFPQVLEDQPWKRVSRFTVRGERLTLNPGELAAVFPPRGSQGEFGNVLPHAVFTRSTLPWERSAFFDEANKDVPWLALLVLDAAPTAPKACAMTVADLKGGGLPDNVISYGSVFATDEFGTEMGERPDDPCQAIDVPLDLFWQIAPSAADLRLLVHTRTVSTARKAGPAIEDQTNAVIVANRLAADPAMPRNPVVVHLVSLEGLGPWLPDDDRTQLVVAADHARRTGHAVDTIRLISLTSWTFAAVEPKESFAAYLRLLDAWPFAVRAATGVKDVDAAGAAGYVALPHTTRSGDRTVSWYRGPLVPAAVPASPPAGPVMVADAAVRFDGATGMQDVGVAAAWQLGRAMMLAQRDTALALADWKRDAARGLAVTALPAAGASGLHQMLAAAGPGDNPARPSVALLALHDGHLR